MSLDVDTFLCNFGFVVLDTFVGLIICNSSI